MCSIKAGLKLSLFEQRELTEKLYFCFPSPNRDATLSNLLIPWLTQVLH